MAAVLSDAPEVSGWQLAGVEEISNGLRASCRQRAAVEGCLTRQ